jgi:hypothetical protein
MCADCDALTNPDPFSALAEALPGSPALPTSDGLRSTGRGTALRKHGLKLIFIGIVATVVAFGIVGATFYYYGFVHMHLALVPLIYGPAQVLRGAYLCFVSGRRLERAESRQRFR